jgi:hypothetical protein
MLIAGSGVGGIGCAIPLLVAAAIFAGRWIDKQLGTTPWVLMAMLLTSIVAGIGFMISSAYSAARAAQRQYESSRRDSSAGELPENPHDKYGEESH